MYTIGFFNKRIYENCTYQTGQVRLNQHLFNGQSFTAFEADPIILHLYGNATSVQQNDSEWDELYGLFLTITGVRKTFKLTTEMVQASRGCLYHFLSTSPSENRLMNGLPKKAKMVFENIGHNGIG